MTWGNPLQGTLPSKGARRRTESLEGTDDRVTELAGHLNQARANSEAGEGDPRRHQHAGALHRRELATRGLPPYTEGWGPRHRRTERGIVRGAPGGQPPVASRPCKVRAIPGTAGAAGAHPEGRWDGDPSDRHPDLRGQGPAARGGNGDRRGLRAGVLRLLVRLPAGSLATSSAARGPERGVADGWGMDRRGRHPKVFGDVVTLHPVC